MKCHVKKCKGISYAFKEGFFLKKQVDVMLFDINCILPSVFRIEIDTKRCILYTIHNTFKRKLHAFCVFFWCKIIIFSAKVQKGGRRNVESKKSKAKNNRLDQ